MQSQQNNIVIGSYTFDSRYCIGQGSFGKVYKGQNVKNKQVVAIKELDRALISQEEINKEIQILKSLVHPNIVKYEDAIKTNQFIYIITQYCNGGDLRNMLQQSDSQNSDQQSNSAHSNSNNNTSNQNNTNLQKVNKRLQSIIQMFFQICQGFNYLHKFNIIHRDMKPTNILINNGVYKIADFGVARTEQLHKSLIHNDLVGVPIYMSPQVLSKNFYSFKCDVWSLGVIMYQFYFQKLPWKATDVNNLFFQIMSQPEPYLNQSKSLAPIMKCIFESTLKYLEKERLSWQQLLKLQKNRKKIFTDFTKSKSAPQNPITPKLQQQPYTDLSSSKINKSIPTHESQIVHHVISQCKSLQQQLITLVGVECFNTFITSSRNYLLQGIQYRQLFVDCGFFLLKIAGENLHLYMLDLEVLEEARPVLILLELVHDVVTIPGNLSHQEFRKVIGNSYRSANIDQYAASVISKINTYRLKSQREF